MGVFVFTFGVIELRPLGPINPFWPFGVARKCFTICFGEVGVSMEPGAVDDGWVEGTVEAKLDLRLAFVCFGHRFGWI